MTMNELPSLWRPHLQAIAEVMGKVLRVRWDRMIDGGHVLRFYGWVDRPDGRADFVLLDVEWRAGIVGQLDFSTSTSSADPALNAELAHALGLDPDDHEPCKRIEEVFGGLVPNAIRLTP